MRLVRAAAGDRQQISDLDLGRHQGLPVDERDDRSHQQIDEQHECGGERCKSGIAGTGQNADRRYRGAVPFILGA